MPDEKINNSQFKVIIQKTKKNRIGIDLLCIIIELYCIVLYLLNSAAHSGPKFKSRRDSKK